MNRILSNKRDRESSTKSLKEEIGKSIDAKNLPEGQWNDRKG